MLSKAKIGDRIRAVITTGNVRKGDEFTVTARHNNFGAVIVETDPNPDLGGKVTSFLIPDSDYVIIEPKMPQHGDLIKLTEDTFVINPDGTKDARREGTVFIAAGFNKAGAVTTKDKLIAHGDYYIVPACDRHLYTGLTRRFPEKPPLGLKPRYIAVEHRLAEINEAVVRYIDANYKIPSEWLEEREELIEYLAKERK